MIVKMTVAIETTGGATLPAVTPTAFPGAAVIIPCTNMGHANQHR